MTTTPNLIAPENKITLLYTTPHSNTVDVPLHQFAIPLSVLGSPTHIPIGSWDLNIYAKADESNDAGRIGLRFYLLGRNAGSGVYTNLVSGGSDLTYITEHHSPQSLVVSMYFNNVIDITSYDVLQVVIASRNLTASHHTALLYFQSNDSYTHMHVNFVDLPTIIPFRTSQDSFLTNYASSLHADGGTGLNGLVPFNLIPSQDRVFTIGATGAAFTQVHADTLLSKMIRLYDPLGAAYALDPSETGQLQFTGSKWLFENAAGVSNRVFGFNKCLIVTTSEVYNVPAFYLCCSELSIWIATTATCHSAYILLPALSAISGAEYQVVNIRNDSGSTWSVKTSTDNTGQEIYAGTTSMGSLDIADGTAIRLQSMVNGETYFWIKL